MALDKNARIYVAGHRGLVGSAIFNELRAHGFRGAFGLTRAELNLLDQKAVEHFFEHERPEYVILAAARVGGIKANDAYPATFLYENLEIQGNVINSAARSGVKKLLFLGSSCIYPRLAPQPMKESCLLSGPLESTNEWYAIAKIAGIKMCQAYRRQFGCDFISAMPTNMYGPNDNFDLDSSHVIPALIRKFTKLNSAKLTRSSAGARARRGASFFTPKIWRGPVFSCSRIYSEEQFINVGSGSDLTIKELAQLVRAVVGFRGPIAWDPGKPDGTPRKLMDSSRLNALGWSPFVNLEEGLRRTYDAFLRGEKAERS